MKKKLLIINLISAAMLLILFVPIKFKYRDGGTVDYRALTYRVIKWNKLNNNGTYYQAKDIIFFPNNFHSIEYYEPVELPNIYVASDAKEIMSISGSAHWSKVVDGKTISAIFDSVDTRDGNYKESITINNQESINIKTNYEVSSVKIQSINKEDNENYQVQYDNKKISFNNIKDGTYVVTYRIENDKDYAYYSFKVVIHN